MMSYAPSLKVKAQAELEWRRRQQVMQAELRRLPIVAFALRTQIEAPNDAGAEVGHVPFDVWPAQADVLSIMERERLAVFLKSRQVGLSWLACLFAMRNCSLYPGYPVLCLSRSQDDADELIHRISFMYHQHRDRLWLSRLTKDNTADLEWANDSSVVSLAATRNAGRGFTGALAILDEWAFMQWPNETLAAVKPTIDAGGKLFIISSADGNGTPYHQFWQAAERGSNGYTAVFLPWTARPDRGADWREQKTIEASGDTASVLREYPANPIEAFTHAVGLIYDVWADPGNVTEEAEYEADAGEVTWFIDDGYVGKRDGATGHWTADSHPRVFLLAQLRHDGTINVFAENDQAGVLSDVHIGEVLALPYPAPDFAVVDKSAAELKGRLHTASIYTRNSPADVEESTKELRRALAPDANGRRRVRVHPRCTNLRAEMVSYRRDANGKIIKAFDHSIDALRYGVWSQRFEQ